MNTRVVHNFSAGPAQVPKAVMQQAQAEFLDYQGLGVSVAEISHRSPYFLDILESLKRGVRSLLDLPEDFAVLFLHGGCSLQYAMIPLNFLHETQSAAYINTGIWSQKALQEAQKCGSAQIVADGAATAFRALPDLSELELPANTAYLHYTDNNTIYGTEFRSSPLFLGGDPIPVPLISDMTSSIFSKRLDLQSHAMIYGGGQKFMGIAGFGFACIRQSLLEGARQNLPSMLDYNTLINSDSLYNTPATFPLYLGDLVLQWIQEQGGIDFIAAESIRKSDLIYSILDSTDFYIGSAHPQSRSRQNVTFALKTPELEAKFLEQSAQSDLLFLRGHKRIGGLRASLYVGMPYESVEALAEFMRFFEQKYG